MAISTASRRTSGSASARQIDDELRALDGLLEGEGKLGDEVVADEVDDRDVAEAGVGAESHFQGARFPRCARRTWMSAASVRRSGVGVEAGGAGELHGGVEPAEERFALGVEFVIHLHRGAGALLARGNGARTSRRVRCLSRTETSRISACGNSAARLATQGSEPLRRQQLGFSDDDEIGLLQLLAVNVEDFLGEFSALHEAEDSLGADGIDEDAERRDEESVAVNPAQRVGHRRDEIGATADGLGDEDIRTSGVAEFARSLDEGIEAAAKTAAWDLLGGEAFATAASRCPRVRCPGRW